MGSVNLDQVQTVHALPRPGETVHGTSLAHHNGGKGANQAVAAARMGAAVRFVGAVGSDAAGERLRSALIEDGIDVTDLRTVDGPTGLAVILVAEDGENVIVLEAGANGTVSPDDLSQRSFEGAAIALFQLELPLEAVRRGLEHARAEGALTVLNAAPPDDAEAIPNDLIDVLVVNESEAAHLASRSSSRAPTAPTTPADPTRPAHTTGPVAPADPTALLSALAPRHRGVVLTLGAAGVVWSFDGVDGRLPARQVTAVDTTGAGDTFTGALVARLAAGESWEAAMDVATAAAAHCVARVGAQPSIPRLDEL